MSNLLIIGTGSLATLYAARIAQSGVDVSMLGTWQAGLDALRLNGATIVDSENVSRSYPVHIAESPQKFKLALVLVKAWQTKTTAEKLNFFLDDDGIALTLQNGAGNREILSAALGADRVALGVTTTGAALLAPGQVRAGGEGKISVEHHPRLAALENILRGAGFNLEVVTDAQSLIWGKLVINAAINPLTALLNVPNGELLKRESAHALMIALAQETANVANALGIKLPFEDAVKAAEDVAQKTAANISSMLQDVRRGAPTEIDAICGEIVRAGERSGVDVSTNRVMLNLIHAMGV